MVKCVKAFVVVGILGAVSANAGEYRPNEVIVKYKDGVRRSRFTMEGIYDVASVVKVSRFHGKMKQFETLTVEEGSDIKQTIAELEKNPEVEYAQPNYIVHALPTSEGLPPPVIVPGPDAPVIINRPLIAERPIEVNPPLADPNLGQAYGLAKIGAIEAWKTNKGSSSMIVAVIDTGVDYNHEDLAYNMWRNPNGDKDGLVGWDFVHNDNLPFDDNKHGTHCSGTIGAVGGNGKGVSGVNQRVSIMALKFLSAEGSGDTAGAIKAIDYAISHGAKVLSNSWGGKDDDDNKGLRDAIQRAEDKDVLFIAAAGNDGTDNDKDPTFPASMNAPNMISVAATDDNDDRAYFSNFGKASVQVGAPGMSIYSTTPGNGYGTLSGTSMACPHVAGAAALVWSSNPKMTYKEVKSRLMESVDKIPALEGKTVTGGRINVARALSLR